VSIGVGLDHATNEHIRTYGLADITEVCGDLGA